jgi:hypothetical protein
MELVIKCFKTALKGHKEYPNKNKSRGKHSCFKCSKSGHFIAQCLNNEIDCNTPGSTNTPKCY